MSDDYEIRIDHSSVHNTVYRGLQLNYMILTGKLVSVDHFPHLFKLYGDLTNRVVDSYYKLSSDISSFWRSGVEDDYVFHGCTISRNKFKQSEYLNFLESVKQKPYYSFLSSLTNPIEDSPTQTHDIPIPDVSEWKTTKWLYDNTYLPSLVDLTTNVKPISLRDYGIFLTKQTTLVKKRINQGWVYISKKYLPNPLDK